MEISAEIGKILNFNTLGHFSHIPQMSYLYYLCIVVYCRKIIINSDCTRKYLRTISTKERPKIK